MPARMKNRKKVTAENKVILRKNNTLFFDDDCSFCSYAVKWVKKRLRNQHSLSFLALRDPKSLKILKSEALKNDSVVFLTEKQTFFKSEAILFVTRLLRFPWNILSILIFLPKSWRDTFYQWIARHRHYLAQRFFSNEKCTLPPKNRPFKDKKD